MSPIRIGFVGLSKRGWARTAHFPYLSKSPHYEIAAIVNSSEESSQAAIKDFGLPSSTKAYGSIAELVKDPDIDLVVVSVKAPDHYAATKPVLEAGKNVYVEWPLGYTLQEAEELAQLAKEKGVKTIVGAQGGLEPVGHTVKKLVESGTIGRITSSETMLVPSGTGRVEAATVKYLFPKESSGMLPLIYFAHWMTTFTATLGQVNSLSSLLPVQYPVVDLVDRATNQIIEKDVPKPAPDHVYVQGRLTSGAVFSLTLRGGQPINGLGCVWNIHGENGDIQVTSPICAIWCGPDGMKIRIKTTDEEEKEVPIEEDECSKLGPWAANIGRLYEEYAKGDKGSYMDFEKALKMHYLLDKVLQSSERGQVTTID
ncbi:oxidoreductase [Rhizodiscina lignyota]|uniref:Oxidoreductase n=1 Tax=Rhizodiscina lignyota TaxID=1504668 RepID=A0A9P4IMT0_9PEZI|nr:oxidoreductase [Rhizodiscina lignyota]